MEGDIGEGLDPAPRLLMVHVHKTWCPSPVIHTDFHHAQHQWMEEQCGFTVY